MVCLGLDELTFSEVFNQDKADEGKKLAKIGN